MKEELILILTDMYHKGAPTPNLIKVKQLIISDIFKHLNYKDLSQNTMRTAHFIKDIFVQVNKNSLFVILQIAFAFFCMLPISHIRGYHFVANL